MVEASTIEKNEMILARVTMTSDSVSLVEANKEHTPVPRQMGWEVLGSAQCQGLRAMRDRHWMSKRTEEIHERTWAEN